MTTPTTEAPVLIVGSGPAGMTTALLLARYAVKSLVVEKHTSVSPLPRARGVHARAMEILRGCGVEAEMRAHALPITPGAEWRPDLVQPALHEVLVTHPELAPVSPCDGLAIAQDVFEAVLRAQVKASAEITVRMGSEVTGLTCDFGGVTATVVDRTTGRETTVRSRYVVGADGSRSSIRHLSGIEMDGPSDLGSRRSGVEPGPPARRDEPIVTAPRASAAMRVAAGVATLGALSLFAIGGAQHAVASASPEPQVAPTASQAAAAARDALPAEVDSSWRPHPVRQASNGSAPARYDWGDHAGGYPALQEVSPGLGLGLVVTPEGEGIEDWRWNLLFAGLVRTIVGVPTTARASARTPGSGDANLLIVAAATLLVVGTCVTLRRRLSPAVIGPPPHPAGKGRSSELPARDAGRSDG